MPITTGTGAELKRCGDIRRLADDRRWAVLRHCPAGGLIDPSNIDGTETMELKTIYTADVIARLELGWGEGWLSPGGQEEVSLLVSGLDIQGKTVLDIGVGAGGPALLLLAKFGAGHVTGVDVEPSVLDRARSLAAMQHLEDRLDLQCLQPGPLPFANGQFDVVFSKDSFVHISDKTLLFSEIFRVLAPGGVCVFSDWCCDTPPYSPEMEQFLQNGMDFSMTTSGANTDHLIQSGFAEIAVRDRNAWFAEYAEREVADAVGPKRQKMIDEFGSEAADRITATAKRRAIIGHQGHLRPTHFAAKKPNRTV